MKCWKCIICVIASGLLFADAMVSAAVYFKHIIEASI